MKKNILFCGTPMFATASLIALFNHQDKLNYELKGVVTIEDKISGRGQKSRESEVKKEAKKLNLQIFTPNNLSNPNFIDKIKKLDLDLIIVVAFKKLPSILFEVPKIGTINLHASLLPKYRGAAPINWALINGEKKTGLTTFFINEKIDEGDIILQSSIDINEQWHANDLHDILMRKSDQIIYKTIELIFNGTYKCEKQIKSTSKQQQYARKIHKSDLKLNNLFWNKMSLNGVFNFIKGMSPPGVKTTIIIDHKNKEIIKKNIIIKRVSNYKNHQLDTYQANKENVNLKTTEQGQLIITNGMESFEIERIKIENGKEMGSKEFYNGFIKNKNKDVTISIYKEC